MAFTYSFNPATSPKDALRFFIGDTDCKDPLLQDEELEYLLGLYNDSPTQAAIRAVESIMLKFSRLCDETVGSVSIQYSQKAKAMALMKADLITRLATEDMTPFAGGISRTTKIAQDRQCDRVRPKFTKNEDDNRQIAPWITNDGDYYRGA
jgi:hypothetical protein